MKCDASLLKTITVCAALALPGAALANDEAPKPSGEASLFATAWNGAVQAGGETAQDGQEKKDKKDKKDK
jgi:hypothetical protein